MLASITPLGERGRGRRWSISAPSFVVGSAVGGLLVGAVAGLLGAGLLSLLDDAGVRIGTPARAALLAVAAVAALAVDRLPGRTRAPGPRRQVNEDWLEVYREWVYGGGFGLQLGAAVLTQVATAAVYVMLLAAALTGSVVAGALIGTGFGVVRALPLLATRGVHDAASLHALHRRSRAFGRPAHRLSTAALLGVAATAAGASLAAGEVA
ncbi:MAG TPA: hypothetical protein VNU26_01965 [Mycobacteriales bacterium]|nr:hypothetical protein [Mycobacteriales bacterium]